MMMGIGLIGPVLPRYAQTFGVSTTLIGFLITIFGIMRMLVDIPAGHLAERIGRRPVLVSGPLILSLGSIGCGLATSYWQLAAFRLVQGIGSALFTTTAMIMLADISTPANRGRIMSLYQGSLLLGSSLGPTMGGLIAEHYGLEAPFFCFAIFTFLAAIWAYLRLPETRSATALETINNPHPAGGMKNLLFNANFILISVVTWGIFFTRTGAQLEIIPLLSYDRLGLSVGQVGIALTLVALLQFLVIFIAGGLSDRWGRKAIIVPGVLLNAVSLVMLSQSYAHWFLLVSCALLGVGSGFAGPVPAAYVVDISPQGNYGKTMGLYRAIGDLGFVIGPVLLGWLVDLRDFNLALWFNGGFLLLSALLFQLLAKETVRH
jgi:multidrug resistance protein